jgi:hypothetical protein
MDPGNAKNCIQEIIKEKHEHFEKNKKKYPNMDTVYIYKLYIIFILLCVSI